MSNALNIVETNYIRLLNMVKHASNEALPKINILIATKNQNEEKILHLIKKGHLTFGENRIQEAEKKWAKLKNNYPKTQLHMIGHLQTNKIRQALKLFDVIQTLDREKLAIAIAKEQNSQNISKSYYIQINIGNESQKSGISTSNALNFINFCRHDLNLRVKGLMCIPPKSSDNSDHFQKMQQIAQESQLHHLSMGMSNDFEESIKFGSTMIRVGKFIFG